MNWWEQLDKTRGSRPRCVALVDGSRTEVAGRLTDLVGLHGVVVGPDDKWMPQGKPVRHNGAWDTRPADEAKLGDPNDLVPAEVRQQLRAWWLAIPLRANTPNWDIASTCTVFGDRGVLLVEAKAHHKELQDAEVGQAPGAREENRAHIGEAIEEANRNLSNETRLDWRLSRDSRYQMSNRFAWAWKLTQLGYPVVLVYLGFLDATDMASGGPIRDDFDWNTAVHSHSRPLFPVAVWRREWIVHRRKLIPLIRTIDQPFDQGPGAEA